MTSFSSLRVRLVGTVFLAVLLALAVLTLVETSTTTSEGFQLWARFAVGLVALMAAWLGGERFIMRQVQLLSQAARGLAVGDLGSRTGIGKDKGELAELGRTIDRLAESLQERNKERERHEKALLNRSFQQTVVSALGQFALVSGDFRALLNQAVMLVAQTLGVEYCGVFELQPDGRSLILRAGVGWHDNAIGKARLPTDANTLEGLALTAGEPVIVERLPSETRFGKPQFLADHGVMSGVTVLISGQGKAYGTIGVHTTHFRKFSEDEVHFMLAVSTVLAMAVERARTEAQLQKLAAFAQLNPNPAMELSVDGKITYFNDSALDLAFAAGHSHPRSLLPANIHELISSTLQKKGSERVQTQLSGRTLSWLFHPVPPGNAVHAYVEDITERLNLQAQLFQSQKMESVGQLAAGVAHDFNNMLTIIQGHAGMLLARADMPQEVSDSAQAIYFGAERASTLTRQLLMFGRKNVVQLKQLDLHEVVTGMGKMLQRLLGETIKLEVQGPENLPSVKADAGMVEQVLMNLAVNARDAMPKGGTLSITTFPIQITPVYAQTHPQARIGQFLCVRVKDTGTGMDEATRSRIYEPFFTTKEVGKGTGLGLATVYGIVKQHEGWIECESELNYGTTFKVFFPVSQAPAVKKPTPAEEHKVVQGGSETVLIVEDEPVLRRMAQVILSDCGYRILQAGTGVEALNVWQQQKGNIDLLLTDMVMPEGMSGMDLAQRLVDAKPDLKVIFASGYSMDNLDTEFLSQGRAVFLQKPYTHITLTKAVRECLDGKPEGAPQGQTEELGK